MQTKPDQGARRAWILALWPAYVNLFFILFRQFTLYVVTNEISLILLPLIGLIAGISVVIGFLGSLYGVSGRGDEYRFARLGMLINTALLLIWIWLFYTLKILALVLFH